MCKASGVEMISALKLREMYPGHCDAPAAAAAAAATDLHHDEVSHDDDTKSDDDDDHDDADAAKLDDVSRRMKLSKGLSCFGVFQNE